MKINLLYLRKEDELELTMNSKQVLGAKLFSLLIEKSQENYNLHETDSVSAYSSFSGCGTTPLAVESTDS